MRIGMVISLFLVLFQSGCKPDSPPKMDPPLNNDSALNVVWKIPKTSGMGALSSYACLYNSVVIFSVEESKGSFFDVIIGLDKNTGKELWRTNKSFYLPSYFQQIDNLLIFEGESKFYALEMLTGKIVWEAKCPYSNMSRELPITYSAGKIWGGWYCGDYYKGDSAILFSIEPINGNLRRIKSWKSKDNGFYQFGFNRVGMWIHPKGDSILILNSKSYNWNTNLTKADMIAWNLNADTAYLDIRGYEGWDGLLNPLVIDNNVILSNQWEFINSINLITLKTNWKLQLPDINKTNSWLTYHNGYLMTSPSTNRDAITFINPDNGSIKHTLLGVNAWYYGYHFKDNFVYFANAFEIKKVDYTIPKLIWKFASPDNSDKGDEFNGNMALDVANDLIYITDYGNFYCLKIKK